MNIGTRRKLALILVALMGVVWPGQADGAAAPIKQPNATAAAGKLPKGLLPGSKRTILPTRKYDRFAFAAVWEATSETNSSFMRTARDKKARVSHFSQQFKLVTALAGKHPPEFSGRWAYRCAVGAGERPIRKGERVILIIHRGGMCAELVFPAKALADTPQNREAVAKAVKAVEHVKMLKKNIGTLVVELHLVHPGLVKAMRETNLVLSAGPKVSLADPALVVRIDKKQVEALLDHLAETGYFLRADAIAPNMRKTFKRPPAPAYLLTVSGGGWGFQENLGWDVKMLKRLDALRAVLKGDAAKAMDKLLKALDPQRKKLGRTEHRLVHPLTGKMLRMGYNKRQQLIKDGKLKDGMTPAEAEAVLGPPTTKTATHLSWYNNPGHRLHVAPFFTAKLKDGRLSEWRTGNR